MAISQQLRSAHERNSRSTVAVHLGEQGIPIGELSFVQQGRRQFSVFSYAASWLANPDRFEVSPDLALATGFQTRKASESGESVFHSALADTEPMPERVVIMQPLIRLLSWITSARSMISAASAHCVFINIANILVQAMKASEARRRSLN